MKSRVLIVSVVLLSCFVSCVVTDPYVEPEMQENKYCITRMKDSPDSVLLSKEDFSIAKNLFEFNKLDDSNLQFYEMLKDDLGYYHVKCNQYTNGLKIFTENVIFHFKQNICYFCSGNLITQLDLDTIPKMPADAVAEKYLERLEEDSFYQQSGLDAAIQQGCFEIEFGYHRNDASTGDSYNNYTKTWKINPKGKEYPYAYINDNTSEVIYYDNGIRY